MAYRDNIMYAARPAWPAVKMYNVQCLESYACDVKHTIYDLEEKSGASALH
jgi:hypothetical protein